LQGIEFGERNVSRLLEHEPMAAPRAASLAIAWPDRIALLACTAESPDTQWILKS